MIPDEVYLAWQQILIQLIQVIMSNSVTAMFFCGVAFVIVINLIYKFANHKEDSDNK